MKLSPAKAAPDFAKKYFLTDLALFMGKDVLKYIKIGNERGQIMTEFVIIMVMCLGFVLALMILFYYLTEYGERMLDLVSIDYP
jgi:hypothetical protein